MALALSRVVHWTTTPTEYLGRFQPPFCPWRACPEHLRRDPGYRYKKDGTYSTKRRRRVQRYVCKTCGQSFSRQTFSVTYYKKRPELLQPVAAGLVAGSAFRQLARSLHCSPTTVARISAHLGRHALLLHAHALKQLEGRLSEAIAFDHFETFEFTQDFPFGVGTAVGARSWFLYGLDPAPHGRTGRRSAAQERRLRLRPRRDEQGRYVGSVGRVLDQLLRLLPENRRLRLISDAHPDYLRALRSHPERRRVELLSCPNPTRGPKGTPRSAKARRRDAAMFPVDLLHKIFRHSLAHHRRETIAFSRRLNAAMERFFLMAAWRNFIKKRTEQRRDPPTPAMSVGLTDTRWTWRRVLARRLFHDRQELSETWSRLYRREWTTPLLDSNARHDAVRAF